MRKEITKRMAQPPAPIASLSEEDQRELRDILKRAVESISEEDPDAEPSSETAPAEPTAAEAPASA
jgi:hypothetical protein